MASKQFLYLEQQRVPICININHILSIVKDAEKDNFYINCDFSKTHIMVNKQQTPIDYDKIHKFVLEAL